MWDVALLFLVFATPLLLIWSLSNLIRERKYLNRIEALHRSPEWQRRRAEGLAIFRAEHGIADDAAHQQWWDETLAQARRRATG